MSVARKSRKNMAVAAEPVLMKSWRAAVYVRLSVEDKRTRTDSIETQQMIIAEYLAANPDIDLAHTYIDNGTTGTNFQRPAFQEMLEHIEAGSINCVIVKDLSRLGRNSIDTGYYIERYFPSRHVRFIAVNEEYDTEKEHDERDALMIPLRNMINEAYSIDIGRKIKAQQRQAMKDGKFVGARAPYGYRKSPDDCHQLIVDPEAAEVVRQMFQWVDEGIGINNIVFKLNEASVLPPSHYKKLHDEFPGKEQNYRLGATLWQSWSVRRILGSPVYVGDMVQGKTKIIDHCQVPADKDEYTIVHNTHEAIISREQFARVQQTINEAAQKAIAAKKKTFTPNIFKGKLFCAHCGRSLHRGSRERKKSDDVYALTCVTRYRYDRNGCPGIHIYEHVLSEALVDMIQRELDMVLDKNLLSRSAGGEACEQYAVMQEQLRVKQQEIQRLRGLNKSLYESLMSDILTQDEFRFLKAKYDAQINAASEEAQTLDSHLRKLNEQKAACDKLSMDTQQLKNNRALTAELVERLIERIEISRDHQITVTYRFTDVFDIDTEVQRR